jgi:hypothetical protein
MATFNWVISTTEYDLQPADMDGAIIVAHWRCNAEQTEGTGDDAVTYSATNYGTAGFSPDLQRHPITRPMQTLLSLRFLIGYGLTVLIRTAIETSLQANIDAQINPVTASGVPW